MTSTHPARDPDRRAEDALHRRLLRALFGGIFVLAFLGISVSALAMHDHEARRPRLVAAWTAPPPPPVRVILRGGNKVGSDGKRHDSWSVTDFRVASGQPTQLVIDNRDDAPHTMTAPQAGVDIVAAPGLHTYTLLVSRPGRYHWFCRLPCDDWAMSHAGYMSGWIQAT